MRHQIISLFACLLGTSVAVIAPPERVLAADAPPADAQTIRPLTTALLNGTPEERLAAAKAIAALKTAGKPAIPALFKAMEVDPDKKVQLQLIATLDQVGLGDPSEIDELLRIIKKDPESMTAFRALIRLHNWAQSGNPAADKLIAPMIDLLSAKNLAVRSTAILVLNAFGEKARDAVPLLIKIAKNDPEPAVRVDAVGTLVMYYDIVDPLCGTFAADEISFDFHRGGTDEYAGTIRKGQTKFKALAKKDGENIKGSFKTADGASFDFTLAPKGNSVVLQTGTKTYTALKQPAKKSS